MLVRAAAHGPALTDVTCAPGLVARNVYVCIFACGDDKDCPREAECKGVEGTSLKGCRYKD